MKFIVFNINIINQSYQNIDDFFIQCHCEIGVEDELGGEALLVNIVSPKALHNMLTSVDDKYEYRIGRGYLIISEFRKDVVIKSMQKLVNRISANSWDCFMKEMEKYFDWI